MEAVPEGAWVVPVLRADVASRVRGYAAGVDDDAEDDEADTCDNLDDSEDEFDLWYRRVSHNISCLTSRGHWDGGSIVA